LRQADRHEPRDRAGARRWLAVLDADDWYHSDRMSALVTLAEARQADMAATTSFSMTPAPTRSSAAAWPTGQTDWDLSFDDFLIGSNAYRTFNLGMLNYRSSVGSIRISPLRRRTGSHWAGQRCDNHRAGLRRPQVGLNGDTSTVSGSVRPISGSPHHYNCRGHEDVASSRANAPAPQPKTVATKEDWTRWNDYGIGLFLQGDLKAAAAAFEKNHRG